MPEWNLEEAKRMYAEDKLSCQQIADIFSMTLYSVMARFKKANVKMRTHAEAGALSSARSSREWNVDHLVKLYNEEGLSTLQIAESLGANVGWVRTLLMRAGVVLRNYKEAASQSTRKSRPRKYYLNEAAFDCADSNDEAAYWTGFLLGDGCIVGNLVKLSLAVQDKCHIQSFVDFLESNYPVKVYSNYSPEGFGQNAQDRACVAISSRRLVSSLARYGVLPQKTGSEHVEILHSNPHFWRGVIDADGWYSINPANTSMATAVVGLTSSAELCRQFASFVELSIGHLPTVIKVKGCHRVCVGGKKVHSLIKVLFGNSLQTKPALPRKLAAIHRIMETDISPRKRVSKWAHLTKAILEEQLLLLGTWESVSSFLKIADSSLRMVRRRLGML